MAGDSEIDRVIILGTGAMMVLAVVIIIFIIIHQRKLFAKQNQINQMRIDNQQRLIKAEIDVKEREQKRIAEELHDDIGTSLSSMRFIVGQVSKAPGAEDLEETLTLTIQKVRRISNDLLPSVLDELGIGDAIRNMIHNLRSVPLEFELEVDNFDYRTIEKDKQLALFRVVQELVNNIIKHAEAKNVKIDLSAIEEEELTIIIEDDGNGIIPERDSAKNPNSLGLKNIESRIEYVGGTINRERAPIKGTIVTIKKPLS